MKTIQNFWSKMLKSMIEARKEQAAYRVAMYLHENNSDFRNVSPIDIKERIMGADFEPSDLLKEIR